MPKFKVGDIVVINRKNPQKATLRKWEIIKVSPYSNPFRALEYVLGDPTNGELLVRKEYEIVLANTLI